MATIHSYHSHIYYDADTLGQARALSEEAVRLFGLKMGRMHERPVGPHPDWSCQLTIPVEDIGSVLGWLALNRKGLVIFTHPETGNELADHAEHAIWMGAVRPLNLGMFAR